MKGKTLLSLAIVLAMILAAIPFAAVKVKAVPPTTISVVFENGLNSITKTLGSDFIVRFNISTAASVGAYKISVVWNTSVLSLKTGTAADVVEGLWMKSFGATIFGVDAVDNVGGELNGIACNLLAGSATGSGTMFTVAFHAAYASVTPGFIDILNPNTVDTYLLDESLINVINIDATVNGLVTVPLPPVTPPKAIITSPVDGSIVTVGDTVALDGSGSTNGIDVVPPPSEPCPINWSQSYWTIDFHNGTIIVVTGEFYSFTCSGPGLVTITLTVIAPDPTPGDSAYVDHDTSAPVSIMQVPVAAGPNIDVYTDRGGEGPLGTYAFGWSDAYGPQEEVCVYAKVTYNGAPVEYKPVEFVVFDAFGDERASYTAFSNASGIAKVCFRIPWQGSDAENYFGNWSIYGTVDISQVQVSDVVMFRFGYLLYIDTVTVGGPYHKLDTMTIDITIGSIAMKDYDAFLQITAVDEANVPIGQAFATITVPSLGYSATGNTIVIPSWAYVGVGTIYVDLLTSQLGVPYCPEKTAVFVIIYP
jgi:hypothetical protein